MMLHPSAALAQCFSCSSCLPGARKQIDIISITVVYKLFSLWFPTWKTICWKRPCTIPLPNSSQRLWSCPRQLLRTLWEVEKSRRPGGLHLDSGSCCWTLTPLMLWYTCPWHGPGPCCPGGSCRDLVETVTAPLSPVHWGFHRFEKRCQQKQVSLSDGDTFGQGKQVTWESIPV